jgi:cbb3-type cytochrome oxidase cytochrome c subunit
MVNDKLVLNEPSAVNLKESKPAIGGQFGEFLAVALSKTASKPAWDMWFRVPPPLVRQGMKVQPAWLHQFLLDPSEIRPGVVLRMPKFNLSSKEAADITAYFAYRDGVETPYEYVRERDEAYLADRLKSHATYLRDGWRLLTLVPDAKAGGAQDKLCANCHNVGGVVVKGSPEELGPNLLLTPDRLRSEWLLQWIASPGRTLPYTGMPKNFDPAARNYQPVFKGTSAEQVAGVRDALVNYHSVQQAEISRSNVPPQSSGGN